MTLRSFSCAVSVALACAPRPATPDPSSAESDAGSGSGTTAAETSTAGTTSAESSGTGESTGDGDGESTTGGDGDAQCVTAADCQLVDDCCVCAAFPAEFDPLPCPADCLVPSCTAIGMHDASAECRLGGCQIAAVSCDPAQVWCNIPAPDCAPGFSPRVADGCWDGCVESRYCDVVSDCNAVDCGDGWICIESQAGSFAPHCEPRPATCEDTDSWCECFAPYPEVCQGGCEEGFSGGVICVDGG